MLTVTKEFEFHSAHLLPGHRGACKNLHGHTYKLQVTAAAREEFSDLDEMGMLVDFTDLKSLVKLNIVDVFDHACILNGNTVDGFERELADLLVRHEKKIAWIDNICTAEHMANLFLAILHDACAPLSWQVVKVRLYETPTSYAEDDFECAPIR